VATLFVKSAEPCLHISIPRICWVLMNDHTKTRRGHEESGSDTLTMGPLAIAEGSLESASPSATQNPTLGWTVSSSESMGLSVVCFLYTRTPHCTSNGFSNHMTYIKKLIVAKATVTSSNWVICRPWNGRAMHCITNQPVCRITTALEMKSPLLLSLISAFDILGKSPLPVREYDCSSLGNSTRMGLFPSYIIKPPITAKKPWVIVHPSLSCAFASRRAASRCLSAHAKIASGMISAASMSLMRRNAMLGHLSSGLGMFGCTEAHVHKKMVSKELCIMFQSDLRPRGSSHWQEGA